MDIRSQAKRLERYLEELNKGKEHERQLAAALRNLVSSEYDSNQALKELGEVIGRTKTWT